jgi:RNA polymerase sigma-70 factor (ECF subfamily)
VISAVRPLASLPEKNGPAGRSPAIVPTAIDGALVLRSRAGDARAFRMIFERHGGAVRRYLRDLLQNDPAADEAAQETFVRAHSRLHSIEDPDRLLPWLLGIARFVFLEQIRQKKRSAPEEAADEPVDEAPTPELALLGREAEAQLASALATLSEARRSALLLRIDHGLPYEDIGQVMGWPLAKVKNEIHRARLQLRHCLAKYVGEARVR